MIGPARPRGYVTVTPVSRDGRRDPYPRVHVWTITSGNEALSAHILVDPSYRGDLDLFLTRMLDFVHKDFGINHATIQLEWSAAGCIEDHHVDHLLAEVRPS